MPNALTRLEGELTQILTVIRELREFRGAINFPALQVLFTTKSENQRLEVAMIDVTGHFFRGHVSGINPDGGTFDVLADDGELVYGMTADRIVSVQLADKK
jgi:hypothetical protein